MSHKVTLLDSKTGFARVENTCTRIALEFIRQIAPSRRQNHVLISHEFVVQNYLLLYHRYDRDPCVNSQGNIIWILPQQRCKIDRSFQLHVLLDIYYIELPSDADRQ